MSVDFSGTWQADLSKSKFLGLQPLAMRVTIEHSGLELREVLLVTRSDGREDRADFFFRTTGEDGTCQLNGLSIRGHARWVGEDLVVETWMKLGEREVYLCDHWSLSADGRTLVMEHSQDALAGQRVVFGKVFQ